MTIGASHCDQLEDTPQGNKIREHSFNSFISFVRVLSSQRRPEPRHRRPSLQVSSSTAKSACAFDTDKLRTNEHVCKNKRSGRSRACARASRRSTTERRSLLHEKTRTRVRISHDEATEAENRTAFAHAHASRLNQR